MAKPLTIATICARGGSRGVPGKNIRPLLGKRQHVEVAWPPPAPVKGHGGVKVFCAGILDDGFNGRETRSACKKYNGLAGLFPKEEASQGPFKAQDILLLDRVGGAGWLTKNRVGECTAGRLADMQLNLLALKRGVRHRVASTLSIFKQNINVLTCMKLKSLRGRELQSNNGDILCRVVDACHPARQLTNRDHALGRYNAGLKHKIGTRFSLAEQKRALGTLVLGQGLHLVGAEVDLAFNKACLAGATGSIFAAIGKHQLGAQGGFKNGLVVVRVKALLRWKKPALKCRHNFRL